MEHHNETPNNNSNEIKVSKKILYISGIILFITVLSLAGYFFIIQPKDTKQSTSNIKKDSINIKKDSISTETGEEYDYYRTYRIIANSITLPNGQILKFGDKVYIHYDEEKGSTRNVYIEYPHKKETTKFALNEDIIIDEYDFDYYKTNFSLPPFSSLPAYMKKALIGEVGVHYDRNDNGYYITQNADRAKNTLTIGDYDGDGAQDIATILDNNETQESKLVVIATNKATKTAYLAFSRKFNTKVKIKNLPKGTSIYMNGSNLVEIPQLGILIDGGNKYTKEVVVYDKISQLFKNYNQEPPTATTEDEDIMEIEETENE